jgi:ABC-type uncharacterized transport system substrate-binding protein
MKRREFIAGIGTVIAWQHVARAQQPKVKVYRVGALLLGIADADSFRTELRDELRRFGYVEELHGKCVELFRDLLPAVRRVAFLGNAADPFSKPVLEEVPLAGRNTANEIAPIIMVHRSDEVDAALAAMKKEGAGAVVVQDSLASKNAAELALKHRLPAATFSRSFVEVGGLLSYGTDGPNSFRQGAVFVKKILQRGNPAEMPIEQPTKFELTINLRTARALGVTIPQSLLVRADEVIQ